MEKAIKKIAIPSLQKFYHIIKYWAFILGQLFLLKLLKKKKKLI